MYLFPCQFCEDMSIYFLFMHLTKYILLLDSNLAHIFESAKKLGTFLVYETNMQ